MIRRKGRSEKTYYEAQFRPRGSGWEVFTRELGWLSMSSLCSATPMRFSTARGAARRAYRNGGMAGDVRVIEHRERVVNVK